MNDNHPSNRIDVPLSQLDGPAQSDQDDELNEPQQAASAAEEQIDPVSFCFSISLKMNDVQSCLDTITMDSVGMVLYETIS